MSPVPVVWSPRCREHAPSAEIWLGVRTRGSEVPERVDVLTRALHSAGHPLVDATNHPDEPILAVHDAALVDQLRRVYGAWTAAGLDHDPGQDQVVPYVFPTAAMLGGIEPSPAAAVHGRAGAFCYDTMTLVGAGTWTAARAAVDCALSAVDLLGAGVPAAYALCRPPGHHATAGAYGGSCYLNSSAIGAQELRRRGHQRVAVIDIDAHHGNGTSAIFYARGDVFYGSVHVDPAAGWFPHFVGHAVEVGVGAGQGANRNIPLAPGSGDADFVAGVARLADRVASFGATAVVVSLGVDAAAEDPESPLAVSPDGYAAVGSLLRQLAVPTVLVQEGGYYLPALGGLVGGVLDAWT